MIGGWENKILRVMWKMVLSDSGVSMMVVMFTKESCKPGEDQTQEKGYVCVLPVAELVYGIP